MGTGWLTVALGPLRGEVGWISNVRRVRGRQGKHRAHQWVSKYLLNGTFVGQLQCQLLCL